MKARLSNAFLVLSVATIVCSPIQIIAQESHIITIDYREIQLTSDDFDRLRAMQSAFNNEPVLQQLLSENSTVFWTHLGETDSDFTTNSSVDTYAISQVNASGYYQQMVALSPETGALLGIESVSSTLTSNFSSVMLEATEYFINSSRYWGRCEKIVLQSGSFYELQESIIWRIDFYLVAETERWTLLLSTNGALLDVSSEDVPCQSCVDYTPFIVVGIAVAVAFPLGYFLFRNEKSEPAKKLPDSNL